MGHVGGQGQQIPGKEKEEREIGFIQNWQQLLFSFLERGQEFSMRVIWAESLYQAGQQFGTGITISLAFFTGDMIYQTIQQSVRGREEALISQGIGGHMVGWLDQHSPADWDPHPELRCLGASRRGTASRAAKCIQCISLARSKSCLQFRVIRYEGDSSDAQKRSSRQQGYRKRTCFTQQACYGLFM